MSADGLSSATADVVVVGGGPAGATAAHELARDGLDTVLLDRAGRIKPCGGAIPPVLLREFDVPESLLCASIASARMVAPSGRTVGMPIEGGFVGMVDRDVFDEWLRARAALAGARRTTGSFVRIERADDGRAIVCHKPADPALADSDGLARIVTRRIVGADGARSAVAKQTIPGADRVPCVFAYHEIIEAPQTGAADYLADQCDVFYQGDLSPDFYAWVFPHGRTASIGVGSAQKGFGLRPAVSALRSRVGLEHCKTLRHEGAPIPLRPARKWDNGRDVVLAGDAAGVVAPASGEGIYYAMAGGREAARAVGESLRTGRAKELAGARRRFMATHGKVFWILGIMQHFWYRSDKRRERFVTMCADPDVQALTWQAYMNKTLVRARPGAHARIFMKDMGHLLGLSPST